MMVEVGDSKQGSKKYIHTQSEVSPPGDIKQERFTLLSQLKVWCIKKKSKIFIFAVLKTGF